VSEDLRIALGAEDIVNMTYDIILGAVEANTVERIREALKCLKPLDLTPAQVREHA
jgi:hypothetical protein